MTTVAKPTLTLRKGQLQFTFLESGDLYQAAYGATMINQWLSNPLDGGLGNIYARLHLSDGIHAYPLLGIQSGSSFTLTEDRMIWKGTIPPEAHPAELKAPIHYQVIFTIAEQGVWFWDVVLEGRDVEVDVIYGQDVGIAHLSAVRSNEAYLSQYIDHTVFEDQEKGYIVCSRQNQPQGGMYPYLQQGSLTGAAGYSTDGFQFFGLSYKETNQPEALSQSKLANEVYQYEFAYTALQSKTTQLNGISQTVFYGLFKEDHPKAIENLEYDDVIREAWEAAQAQFGQEAPSITAEEVLHRSPVKLMARMGEPLTGVQLTQEELDQLYPNRLQEEVEQGALLAFFTTNYEHVVLKEKELRVERPHGHILMSGDNDHLNDQVITTTSYMYGIFNSQLVVGNTNLNKMMSNARNALNIPKTAGQRIYIEIEGKYRLLTMPSLFEMGFNYVRWIYKTDSDLICITNYTTVDSPEVRLHVRSTSGASYRFLVTNQITMNVAEYEVPFHWEQDEFGLMFRADTSSISSEVYPHLTYRMNLMGANYTVGDEKLLAEGAAKGSASLIVLDMDSSSEWTLTIQGLLHGEDLPVVERPLEPEIERYRSFYSEIMNGFNLSKVEEDRGSESCSEELFKVNAIAWWYTHNMLVHFSVPHGLEQYGGAAWGTRDVCQGPAEYFLATHKYEQVREILQTVFSHQYEDDGNWPQWFMFDRYTTIQQEESHGDIIVWPLKVLCDYLTATRDYSILNVEVPYTRKGSFDFTAATASIREHALKEIQYIKTHFLHGTYLSSYGDGDWDDTLQPANAQLKQYMVSSWTVALTYQVMNGLSQVLEKVDSALTAELKELAEGIKRDFNQYMLNTEVIPGFLYFENPAEAKLMLHPTDEETGIHYRLLPMTRSMISELLTPEQAEAHYELISQQLYCPDGVRLMNRPAHYVGGVSVHFKRAEQASNFGREIGLQYVHAHIRYVEAMAKLGKQDQVWRGLGIINPIGIRKTVPNAELRQSNTYFSSSDGKFNTRYEAEQRFDELRRGTAPVKGGWRIYSSGPGIYMNQLISNALGIRIEGGDLMIDPVLPPELDGVRFDYEYGGAPVSFIYRYTDGVVHSVLVNGKEVPCRRIKNRYRQGGLRIQRADYDQACSPDTPSIVEIQM